MKKVILFSLAFLLPNFIIHAQNNNYWNFYRFSDFISNDTVNQVVSKGDSLIFATNNGVTFKYNNTYTTMTPPNNLLASPIVNKVCVGDNGDMLFYHANTGQITYLSNGSYQVFQDSLDGFSELIDYSDIKYNNGLFYFNSTLGIQVFDGLNFKVIDPTVLYQGFYITNDTLYGVSYGAGLVIYDSVVVDSFDYIYSNGAFCGNKNSIGLIQNNNFIRYTAGDFNDTNYLGIPSSLPIAHSNFVNHSLLDSQNRLWIYHDGILIRSDFSTTEYSLDLTYQKEVIYGTAIREYDDKIVLVTDEGWMEIPVDITFQHENTLDINNLNLTLSPNNNIYPQIDPTIDHQTDGHNILFTSSICWSGQNSNTQDYKASTERYYYPQAITDFEYQIFPGAIRNNQSEYINHRTWKVDAVDIQNHISNYSTSNYQVPEGILNWPAHGRTSIGEATCLAPFIDLNNNGLYEPLLGDYPQIRGEQAIYAISNDENSTDGHEGMGIEQHTMIYAYNSISSLQETVFFNIRLVNRSSTTYENFKVGNYTDFDLGYPLDDYVGSDSTRNLYYVYNGDNNDQDGSGVNGFGSNPPAAGVVFLSEALESFVFTTNDLFNTGAPQTDSDIYNLMNGMWKDGSPRGFNYMFNGDPVTGNGFTEANTGNTPYDRNGWGFGESRTFAPGDTIELEMAIMFAHNTGSNNIDAITDLRNSSDAVTQWYQNQSFDAWNVTCIDGIVSVDDIDSKKQHQIKLYPNPTNDLLTIDGIDEQTEVSVYNISGQLVHQETVSGLSQLNVADYAKGMYILSVQNEHLYETHRWIKQ